MTDRTYDLPAPLHTTVPFECHVVERDDANDYLGQKVVELRRTAARRQLETDLGYWGYHHPETHTWLPRGTVSNAFEPSNQRLAANTGKEIKHNIGRGDVYTITYLGDMLMGLAHLSQQPALEPNPTGKSRLQICEVLAARPQKGIGSMMLHGALREAENWPVDGIIMNSLVGNGTNRWFMRFGLQPVDSRNSHSLEIGGVSLPAMLLATASGKTPDDLLRQTEAQHPYLADSRSA